MYWFGRSDLVAAEAWWRRALYLDANHARAQECLRLLARATDAKGAGADTAPPPKPLAADLMTAATQPGATRLEPEPSGHDALEAVTLPGTPPERDPDIPSLETFANSVLDPETPIGSRALIGLDAAATLPDSFELPNWSDDVLNEGTPPATEIPSFLRTKAPPLPTIQPPDEALVPSEPATPAGAALGQTDHPGTLRTGERNWESPLDIEAAAWALQKAASSAPDPFEFAMDGVQREALEAEQQKKQPPEAAVDRLLKTPPFGHTPWDEGPSRTSAITLGNDGEPDALAEATPRPNLETDRFFGRFDPEIIGTLEQSEELSAEEWEARADALAREREGGDREGQGAAAPMVAPAPPLPSRGAGPPSPSAAASAHGPGGDIRFDEPVEMHEEAAPTQSPEALLQQAKDRLQLHDFAGALELLESIGSGERAVPEARALLAEARANLMRMYESKIGSFDQVPHLLISSEELIWLNLNHRAGFILSQIDGSVTYEDIVSLSGMPRLDTLRILAELIQDHVIGPE